MLFFDLSRAYEHCLANVNSENFQGLVVVGTKFVSNLSQIVIITVRSYHYVWIRSMEIM